MSKVYVLTACCLLIACKAFCQKVVYDQKHLQSVNENAVVRESAELSHNKYLEKIDDNLQSINTSSGTVVLAQNMIYNSLSNVNSALKNGMAVKNLAFIIQDMQGYTVQMLAIARSDPYLLLFAEDMFKEMQVRSVKVLTHVTGFILSGDQILADYNSRDELLRTVTQELQIMCSLVYGAWKAMFWAKEKGVFRSVNPYADYLNADRQLVDEIITNAKYLRK